MVKCYYELRTFDDIRVSPIETSLYYCNSRYYNPEWCRWLNADDVSYLEPSDVNGLNLFAYCGNNPVMGNDPTGHFVISLTIGLAALISGAVIGGAYGALTAVANGQNVLTGMLIGAGAGALMGLGAAIAGAFIAPVLLGTATIGGLSAGASLAIGAGIAFGSGFVIGMGSDVALQAINNRDQKIDWGAAAWTGVEWGVLNTLNAFTGGLAGDLTGFASNFTWNTFLNLNYGGFGVIIDVLRAQSNKPKQKTNQVGYIDNMVFAY